MVVPLPIRHWNNPTFLQQITDNKSTLNIDLGFSINQQNQLAKSAWVIIPNSFRVPKGLQYFITPKNLLLNSKHLIASFLYRLLSNPHVLIVYFPQRVLTGWLIWCWLIVTLHQFFHVLPQRCQKFQTILRVLSLACPWLPTNHNGLIALVIKQLPQTKGSQTKNMRSQTLVLKTISEHHTLILLQNRIVE